MQTIVLPVSVCTLYIGVALGFADVGGDAWTGKLYSSDVSPDGAVRCRLPESNLNKRNEGGFIGGGVYPSWQVNRNCNGLVPAMRLNAREKFEGST